MIWIVGIWYAIVKYRFLKMLPAAVSSDMINNILEAVILLNNELKIISTNNKVEEITKKNLNYLIHKDISEIIEEDEIILNEIEKMENGRYSSFSGRIHFKTDDVCSPLMDIRLSIINDDYGDRIGFMIIASEVKELEQLKALYKITPRESQIIQRIVSGLSNKEIALELELSERTIKSHISHIFNKFGVESRIHLIKKLRDFNLIPNHKAEKTLLLLRNQRNLSQ